jgi:hypothetical protein
VHPDRHAELLPRALREADVVEVPVREDDRLDVVRPPSEFAKSRPERSPGGGHAGVDHDERPVVLDEVPVRVRVLDPVDPLGDVPCEHGRLVSAGRRIKRQSMRS